MGLQFTRKFNSSKEMHESINTGIYDFSIMEHLIDVMYWHNEDHKTFLLHYDPCDLFELNAIIPGESHYYKFWDKSESGWYEANTYYLSEEDSAFFDAFCKRIRDIYKLLQKLV